MAKKLLFLFVFLCSVSGFSQATAYPAPNLSQCNNEVFNLTAQTPIILGNQSAQQFTVTYFQAQADAVANVNPIVNPSFFVGVTQTIYARVDNLSDGSFAITSFQISWSSVFLMPSPDVTVCYSYTLPELPSGNYFTEPHGAGIMLLPGYVLTASQTVYVYFQDGNCIAEDSFDVTITPDPMVPSLPNVTACDAYALPALPPDTTYHSAPGGSDLTVIPIGTVITTTATIYLYYQGAVNPNCTAEGNFTVTILQSPPPVLPSRINRCTSYQLPVLPSQYQYFSGPNGTGTTMNTGDVITQSTIVYVHAASSTVPMCTSDWPVAIEIGLPLLNPVDYQILDCDGDGFASFDLNSKVPEILANLSDVNITFYETLADAQLGVNALLSPYFNVTPDNAFVWVRGENVVDGCFSFYQMQLTVVHCANISGVVRVDTDGNGCTASDPPMSGIDVVCTHENDVFHAYTNASGEYQFTNIPFGVNIVYVATGPQIDFGAATPTAHTFNIVASGNNIQDFCITPAAPVRDASVVISANIPARPGQYASYYVTVMNNGNTVLDGSATLTFNPSVEAFNMASPSPSSSTANSLTFNFTGLQPYTVNYYYVQFTIATPPTVNIGNVLQYSAAVTTTQNDADLTNNQFVLDQTVVNSFDPNDISVSREMISPDMVSDELVYNVRFQNTGTADAINVRIENMLDSDLDWSTFRPIIASHSFAAERSGNQVVFRFNNINLPAESINEPQSHGYITYAIKPRASFAAGGNLIENFADIYFDSNAPIITNTVTTQLVMLGTDESNFAALAMYPNPASESVNIRFKETVSDVVISIHDIQGKLILKQISVINGNEAALDISKVQSGLYFLTVNVNGESMTKKLLVK